MQEIAKTLVILVIAVLIFETIWTIFVHDVFPGIMDFVRGLAELGVCLAVGYVLSIHVRDGFLVLY